MGLKWILKGDLNGFKVDFKGGFKGV